MIEELVKNLEHKYQNEIVEFEMQSKRMKLHRLMYNAMYSFFKNKMEYHTPNLRRMVPSFSADFHEFITFTKRVKNINRSMSVMYQFYDGGRRVHFYFWEVDTCPKNYDNRYFSLFDTFVDEAYFDVFAEKAVTLSLEQFLYSEKE